MQRNRQNALIWRDVKVLKGSGGREGGQLSRSRKRQRVSRGEVIGSGSKPDAGMEREIERAAEAAGEEAKR